LAVRARDRGGISYVDLEVRFRPVTLPDELILTPPLDVNPVSTNHTVTATLLDGTGAPKSGVPVRFLVAGSVSTTGSCTTGPDGQCTFTYTGPPFPGADLITAYADQNNDTIQQPTEPADTATKAWEMPTSTAGHVTGGGHVLAPDPIDFDKFDEVAFGFNARSTATGFSGKCTVVDQSRATKTMLKCRDVTALVQTGNKATIFGNATVNDVQTTYRIDVEDNGEPGMGRDIFLIQTTSGYTAGGLLTRGNVQVHQ
jgi:hypothetical protein